MKKIEQDKGKLFFCKQIFSFNYKQKKGRVF